MQAPVSEDSLLIRGVHKLSRAAQDLVPFLSRTRGDFEAVFFQTGHRGVRALHTIRAFCYEDKTTAQLGPDGKIDRDQFMINEGRRQVWLMMRKALRATDEEIVARARNLGGKNE